MTTYGQHPGQMAIKLTLGDGLHLTATSENGWAGPVHLTWGASVGAPVITDVGTIAGNEVSWTFSVSDVEERAEHGWSRLRDNGQTLEAGPVIVWRGGSGYVQTQTIASLTAGPPGPTAVSADAGNALTTGSDGLLYLDEGELGGGTGGDTTAQVGTFTLPESPTEGQAVSILADEATVIPEGITWDSGGEPTVTGRLLIACVWSGVDWVCTYGLPIAAAPEPPDETAPTVPADLTATADGYTAIDLTWSASTDAVGVTGYEYRVDGGAPVDVGDVLAATVSGLTQATEYDFEVRAYDAAGNFSAWSAVVSESTDTDVTPPTPGTLSVTPSTDSAAGEVSGASDDLALHATPYAFRIDGGAWSAWQASAEFSWTSLTEDTEYDFQHKVRDAAGNEATGTAVTDSTDSGADVTNPTPGTLAASAITDTSFTLTVSGASDETALHATPYAFSTDNGGSWSAYQAGASFDASGLTAETEYTCVHRVRDAAGNVATGSSITVETEAAAPAATLSDAILALSPVGYWKLDETTGTTAADSSGNGRDGTYMGTAGSDYTLAATDGLYRMDAGGGGVAIPDHAAFSAGAVGLTVFCLATVQGSLANRYLVAKDASAAFEWEILQHSSGRPTAYQRTPAGATGPSEGGPVLTTGEWDGWSAYCVAFPPENTTNRYSIYRNSGTALSSVVMATANLGAGVNTTAGVAIGKRYAYADVTGWTSGSFGHVAIFTGQLSGAQIQTLIDAAQAEGLIP